MWSYNDSKNPKLHNCDSYEYAIFCIFNRMRFHAVTNSVPDYYIYKDNILYEIITGEELFNIYVENGGIVL